MGIWQTVYRWLFPSKRRHQPSKGPPGIGYTSDATPEGPLPTPSVSAPPDSALEQTFSRGVTYFNARQHEQALPEFDWLITNAPEDLNVYKARFMRARCLERLGRYEQALSSYDEVISELRNRRPDVGDRLIGAPGEYLDDALYNRGVVLYKMRRWAEAEDAFRRLADLPVGRSSHRGSAASMLGVIAEAKAKAKEHPSQEQELVSGHGRHPEVQCQDPNAERGVNGPWGTPETYLRDCLEPRFKEELESRTPDSDPVFRDVLDPLNAGDNAKACSAAEAVVAKFSDFADPYCWWGHALLEMRSFDKAREVLKEGIGKAKSKYPLCELLGEVEWRCRNIKDAVYWWAQALHCHESLGTRGHGYTAYLYLHYVAEGLGLSDCTRAFLMRVDQMASGQIRLNAETADDLTGLARTTKNSPVPEVLRRLVVRYIVPEKKGTIRADPEEVDRLIRQLEETDERDWRAKMNADVGATEKLGELGDPRALESLTRTTRSPHWDLARAAEDAIRRIKEANR